MAKKPKGNLNGKMNAKEKAYFSLLKNKQEEARFSDSDDMIIATALNAKVLPGPVPITEYRDHFLNKGLWSRLEKTDNEYARTLVLRLEAIGSVTPPQSIDVKSDEHMGGLNVLVNAGHITRQEAAEITALGDNRLSEYDIDPMMHKRPTEGRIEQARKALRGIDI